MIIFIIILIIFLGYIESSSSEDIFFRIGNSKLWHKAGAYSTCFFILGLSLALDGFTLLTPLTFTGFILGYWLLFDLRYNLKVRKLIVKDQPIFYVGKSADIDRFFRRWGKAWDKNPSILMLVTKIILIIITITLRWVFKDELSSIILLKI
jgi:hypothetical protein